MKKTLSIILIVTAVLCLFCSCGKSETKKADLTVVCSTFPIYDFVKNIAGETADIILLDSTTDIHSFEPTAQDLITLSQADLFICIGGVSDAWVDKAIASAGNEKLAVLKLMDCVTSVNEETVEGMQAEEEGEEAEADEHIWLSLKNAKLMCESIRDKLCDVKSRHSSTFKSNCKEYIKQLDELDKQYEEAISNSNKDTLVFADRFPFRYLCDDYGLKYYAAFPGCSSETNASFETVSFLIEKVKELNLSIILVTESSDLKIAQTINYATEAGALILNSCQSTHMEDIENGATYLGIMAENLTMLREALY